MPTFYQRPLTWLLVGVFVVFDAMVFAGVFPRHMDLCGYAILCQVYLTAEWAFRGRAHWLARLASSLGAVALAALLITRWQDEEFASRRWAMNLGAVAIILLVTCLSYALTAGVALAIATRGGSRLHSGCRISMIEILGLTMVVALASYLLKGGQYAFFFQGNRSLEWLGGSAMIGAILAIASSPTRKRMAGALMVLLGIACLLPIEIGRVWVLVFRSMSLVGACMFIRSFEPKITASRPDQRQET